MPRPTPSDKGLNPKLLIPVYFLVCFAYLWMGSAGFPGAWRTVVKGLILPVLMLYFHLRVRGCYTPARRWVLAGLAFSWLGDVLLDLEFVYGLSAFLLAHLAFLWAFSRGYRLNGLLRGGLPYLVPVALYGGALLFVLNPHLGPKRLPVLFYTAAILVMLLAALARKGWVGRAAYWLTVAGAILFVLSDSLLAIRTFVSPFPLSGILIMGTYTTAEFLIVEGAVRQEEALSQPVSSSHTSRESPV